MAFGQIADHALNLGAGYIGDHTMFYICEMTGKLWLDHDGVLMVTKNILMIAHILGTTCPDFGGYAIWRAVSRIVLYQISVDNLLLLTIYYLNYLNIYCIQFPSLQDTYHVLGAFPLTSSRRD